MSSPKDESEQRIDRIRKKLDLLSNVLNDLASRMREIAERQEGNPPPPGKPIKDPAAELLDLLRENAERAKEISNKPITFDESCGVPRFRYAQYVEFRNVEEFLRFRDLPAISGEDLQQLDWSELERRLQQDD